MAYETCIIPMHLAVISLTMYAKSHLHRPWFFRTLAPAYCRWLAHRPRQSHSLVWSCVDVSNQNDRRRTFENDRRTPEHVLWISWPYEIMFGTDLVSRKHPLAVWHWRQAWRERVRRSLHFDEPWWEVRLVRLVSSDLSSCSKWSEKICRAMLFSFFFFFFFFVLIVAVFFSSRPNSGALSNQRSSLRLFLFKHLLISLTWSIRHCSINALWDRRVLS